MSKLEKLKKCKTLSDVAHILGYKPKALSFILYKIPEDQKYIHFSISKKSGGVRQIKAPQKELKKLQKRLSNLLHDCTEELLPDNERIKEKK